MKKCFHLITMLFLLFSFPSLSEEKCGNVPLSSDASKFLGLGAVSGVVLGVGGTIAVQKFIDKIEELVAHSSDFENKVKSLQVCSISIEENEWDTVSENDTVVECTKPFDDTSTYFVEWNKNTLLKNMFSQDYLLIENHAFISSVHGLLLDLKSLRGEKIE